jgi:hypothetical protein
MDYENMTEEQLEELRLEEEMKLQLEAWKDEFTAIFVTEIEDIQIIWRGLSRSEFRKVMEYYEDEYERAEYVCRVCVLDPYIEDWNSDIYAGVPETLSENILRESGFTQDGSKIEYLMNYYEQEMTTFDNQVSCIIKEAFQEISLEEIDDWPLEKTMWYYSRAKWSLKTFRNIELEREEEVPGNQPPMG